MKRIIVLSRVSTVGQHLESQTNELVNAAIKLGYPKSSHIIIENVESAIKLKEEERIGLQRLKQYIETTFPAFIGHEMEHSLEKNCRVIDILRRKTLKMPFIISL